MNPQLLTATKKKQQAAEKQLLEMRLYLKSLWLRIPLGLLGRDDPRSISFNDDQVAELYDMATKGEK